MFSAEFIAHHMVDY